MARLAVIGTGLIGASVALALREQGWVAAGWDPSSEALTLARERGAIDHAAATVEEATAGADLVLLAGPLHANLEILAGLVTDALVTDVTSVKAPLAEAAPPGLRFVGGHPMAGREHAGPGAASPGLFRGAPWVICDDGADPDDVGYLFEVVVSVGAYPVVMTADRHDQVVASVSHLPHLLAVSLVNTVTENPDASELVSGSFRDLTRVAATESSWWPEVLAANAKSVAASVDRLVAYLEDLRDRALQGDTHGLGERLELARSRRAGMAPPVARVSVALQDRPGEIARVGHALETSRVDVRDLQLRHAVHGGGGVLTLSVRPGEVETLRSALVGEGFEIETDG